MLKRNISRLGHNGHGLKPVPDDEPVGKQQDALMPPSESLMPPSDSEGEPDEPELTMVMEMDRYKLFTDGKDPAAHIVVMTTPDGATLPSAAGDWKLGKPETRTKALSGVASVSIN